MGAAVSVGVGFLIDGPTGAKVELLRASIRWEFVSRWAEDHDIVVVFFVIVIFQRIRMFGSMGSEKLIIYIRMNTTELTDVIIQSGTAS